MVIVDQRLEEEEMVSWHGQQESELGLEPKVEEDPWTLLFHRPRRQCRPVGLYGAS